MPSNYKIMFTDVYEQQNSVQIKFGRKLEVGRMLFNAVREYTFKVQEQFTVFSLKLLFELYCFCCSVVFKSLYHPFYTSYLTPPIHSSMIPVLLPWRWPPHHQWLVLSLLQSQGLRRWPDGALVLPPPRCSSTLPVGNRDTMSEE